MAPSVKSVLRNKPDLKNTLITTVEAAVFGGFIIATDFIDEEMGLDQTTLKSVSNSAPIIIALVTTVGAAVTKGPTQQGMRDVQLMSTPFAIISIARVLRARGIFGRLFKKKAKSIDSGKTFGHSKHDKSDNTPAMNGSDMSFSGMSDI